MGNAIQQLYTSLWLLMGMPEGFIPSWGDFRNAIFCWKPVKLFKQAIKRGATLLCGMAADAN